MPPVDRIGRLNGPLRIHCRTCRHVATWTPQEARQRLGGECTTVDAKRRLKCSRCGERRTWCIDFTG